MDVLLLIERATVHCAVALTLAARQMSHCFSELIRHTFGRDEMSSTFRVICLSAHSFARAAISFAWAALHCLLHLCAPLLSFVRSLTPSPSSWERFKSTNSLRVNLILIQFHCRDRFRSQNCLLDSVTKYIFIAHHVLSVFSLAWPLKIDHYAEGQ